MTITRESERLQQLKADIKAHHPGDRGVKLMAELDSEIAAGKTIYVWRMRCGGLVWDTERSQCNDTMFDYDGVA